MDAGKYYDRYTHVLELHVTVNSRAYTVITSDCSVNSSIIHGYSFGHFLLHFIVFIHLYQSLQHLLVSDPFQYRTMNVMTWK